MLFKVQGAPTTKPGPPGCAGWPAGMRGPRAAGKGGGRPAAGLPGEQCVCHPVSNRAARAEREAHVCPVFPPGWLVRLPLLLGREPATAALEVSWQGRTQSRRTNLRGTAGADFCPEEAQGVGCPCPHPSRPGVSSLPPSSGPRSLFQESMEGPGLMSPPTTMGKFAWGDAAWLSLRNPAVG